MFPTSFGNGSMRAVRRVRGSSIGVKTRSSSGWACFDAASRVRHGVELMPMTALPRFLPEIGLARRCLAACAIVIVGTQSSQVFAQPAKPERMTMQGAVQQTQQEVTALDARLAALVRELQ